ncbi:MAG: 1-acyl-sn-glycerol-3-phosphate acyltransferase, partial [Gammaproteobacteria bacterium]
MTIFKTVIRGILRLLYRVEVRGLAHYAAAGQRVLIVANHTSFLDALLIGAFLPERLTFAVNTFIARSLLMRPLAILVNLFPMDPTNPLSVKSLIKYLRDDNKAVIFPEGRITVTGALMKVYQGPGLVADRCGAMVLPLRIDGAQYTPFSRLHGRVRTRWFPRITLTLLPPRRIEVPAAMRGRARRQRAGRLLADIMTDMMFATSEYRCTLVEALLTARRVHGAAHSIVEDIERQPFSYRQLLQRAFILGGL